MMFRRKIYDELLEWKKMNGMRALLIEGARFVGKTTIVKEFAEKEYKSYINIDFSRQKDEIKELVYRHFDNLDDFFMHLSASQNTRLYPRESLIIFDEVQELPIARACIKHLVKDGRYDYIETGSLISIKENIQHILIPSEERSVKMYPMDFEEFCWALGENAIATYIRKCFDDRIPLDETIHKRAMHLFSEYMIVGGMPDCVKAYVDERKDLTAVDEKKQTILTQYADDVKSYKSRITDIYNQLPALLSGQNKRVVFKKICPGTSTANYRNTFIWLSESMICNISVGCTDPNVKLSNDNKKFTKCYFGDTGLLSGLEDDKTRNNLYIGILNGTYSANYGMYYENIVAQMLTSTEYRLWFYNHYNTEAHRNDIKIDFLIEDKYSLDDEICPVEAKPTPRFSMESLIRFTETFSDRISYGIIIRPGNFYAENNKLFIPPYMTFCL